MPPISSKPLTSPRVDGPTAVGGGASGALPSLAEMNRREVAALAPFNARVPELAATKLVPVLDAKDLGSLTGANAKLHLTLPNGKLPDGIDQLTWKLRETGNYNFEVVKSVENILDLLGMPHIKAFAYDVQLQGKTAHGYVMPRFDPLGKKIDADPSKWAKKSPLIEARILADQPIDRVLLANADTSSFQYRSFKVKGVDEPSTLNTDRDVAGKDDRSQLGRRDGHKLPFMPAMPQAANFIERRYVEGDAVPVDYMMQAVELAEKRLTPEQLAAAWKPLTDVAWKDGGKYLGYASAKEFLAGRLEDLQHLRPMVTEHLDNLKSERKKFGDHPVRYALSLTHFKDAWMNFKQKHVIDSSLLGRANRRLQDRNWEQSGFDPPRRNPQPA